MARIFLTILSPTLASALLLSTEEPKGHCLNVAKWWEEQLDLKYGQGTHSERDQDFRLKGLFSAEELGTTNKFFVEFGFTGLDNSQSERLRAEENFTGWRMDIGTENPKHFKYHEWVTPQNIVSIFKKYDTPKEPDYVSIDIDSTDVWVFGNMTKEFRPRVLTVEYHSGTPYPVDFESDKQSSLVAVSRAAERAGYTVIGVEPSQDAFLVRKDLICPGTELPISTFAKFTGLNVHEGLPLDRNRRCHIRIGACPMDWTLRSFPYKKS